MLSWLFKRYSLYLLITFLFIGGAGYGQFGSTDKFPVYKIRPDSLVKGYKDKNGLRQGSFFSYNNNGTVNFIRTYVNDTLNGFLGCYSPKGFVNSEQFYMNGKLEGLQFQYQGENKLKSKGVFKNGLKNGIFLEFYDNGNIESEANYINDTISGDYIKYYPNQRIKSFGNPEEGISTYYDENGCINSIITRKDHKIIRDQFFYPDSLKQQQKAFISPKLVKNDTSIINKTNLVVEKMVDNFDPIFAKKNLLEPFEPGFLTDVGFCKKDSIVYAFVENELFVLKPKGLEFCYACIDFDSKNRIDSIGYGTNREVIIKQDGHYDISYPEKDIHYKVDVGELVVHTRRLRCDDTGYNPVTIINGKKTLEFKDINNLAFCEYDSNRDGKKELYLVSFTGCTSRYKIFRIRNK